MEKEEKKPLIILTGSDGSRQNCCLHRTCKSCRRRDYFQQIPCRYTKNGHRFGQDHTGRDGRSSSSPVDVLEPEEEFNVVRFQGTAKEAMKGIYERGHIPIVVGGTGFYIQALLYDIDFTENETDHTYRKELEQLAEEKGEEYLHKLLQEADPESASQIHCHNVKRVIRALEFYHQTGTKISEHNEKEREKEAAYRSAYFVLTDERKRLYERIDRRVEK